jgi:hypothetical protein
MAMDKRKRRNRFRSDAGSESLASNLFNGPGRDARLDR